MRIDRATRVIRAAPAVVYQAFATANALAAWIAPQGMTATLLDFEFREGGSYRMRLSFDSPGHSRGKTTDDSDEVEVRFVKLVPDRRIEKSVAFNSDRPGTRVTVSCENVPAGIPDNLAAFTER